MKQPRYPIYIPSKGRIKTCFTAQMLARDKVPFRLVVEEAEADDYRERFGEQSVLVLPFSNAGSVIPSRNWIKEHATAEGHERHWQLDDNIRRAFRWFKNSRVPCRSGVALRVCEDLTDRYKNVAISGLDYSFFTLAPKKPFTVNCRVYSCSLVLNSLPQMWRGRYNEDADFCLQVLGAGWCTILVHAFTVFKIDTMSMKGGNTDELYAGDGRAKMARSLERLWPGVVETKRRFHRPQHVVKNSWKNFDTPLIPLDDFDPTKLQPVDEYGIKIREVEPIKSPRLRKRLYGDETVL